MAAIPEDFSARLRQVEMAAHSATQRIEAHEDICAERYKNIHEGMNAMRDEQKQQREASGRTNTYLIRIGLALIGFMAAILGAQVFG